MKHKVHIGTKDIIFETYKTSLELEVLEEMCFIDSQDTNDSEYEVIVDDFLSKLCDTEITDLSKIEKIILIWYIRSLTLGDEFNVVYECPNCKQIAQCTLNIDGICKFGQNAKHNPYNSTISKTQFENYTIDSNSVDLENLDFDVYTEIVSNPENFFNIYNTMTELTCPYCKNVAFDNYLSFKNCLKFISEDSFQSLTKWINDLVYYGHFNRSDILSMSPIQRHLHIEYFKQIKKKENGQEGIS